MPISDATTHIVGMMGVEPIQQAITTGAQIVVAGRSSDTSIFAALPLLESYGPAVVWHMAKILECGAAAVAVRTAPDCMMAVLHEDSFDVFPLREDYRCTPRRRFAHALRKCRSVRTEGAVRHLADRQRPLQGDRRSRGARFGVGVRSRPRIHHQIGRGTPSRIFDNPMGGMRNPYILRKSTPGSSNSMTTSRHASATRSANGRSRSSPAFTAATA